MKILHVLDISLPDMAGYTTRSYYLIHGQKKLGVEPVVLTSERQKKDNGAPDETIDGIRYYRTSKSSSMIRKFPVLAQLDEVKALASRVVEVAAKEKVDIIHAHSPSLIGAACLDFCHKNSIPLVYEIRAFWEDAAVDRGAFAEGSFMYRLRRMHETKVVREVDAIINICTGLKGDLIDRGISADRIHIVPNGVDHEQFQPVTMDHAIKEKLGLMENVVIGFIGSFFNFEGLQDLIRAMPLILKQVPSAMLLLVGKGQVEAELKTLTKTLKLEDRVLFTGQVPHDQVNSYYSIIDVLVYPRISKRITELVTPLKPLEAMAMEKVTLMSDVGGLKELADAEGVADFFRAGDVADLATKCIVLCNSPERRQQIGEKARENVVAGWGWDKRAASDIEIYRQLLNK